MSKCSSMFFSGLKSSTSNRFLSSNLEDFANVSGKQGQTASSIFFLPISLFLSVKKKYFVKLRRCIQLPIVSINDSSWVSIPAMNNSLTSSLPVDRNAPRWNPDLCSEVGGIRMQLIDSSGKKGSARHFATLPAHGVPDGQWPSSCSRD